MNDSYSFTTTAPTMTNGDVLAAFTKLQKFAEEYEFIHVVGESDLDLWQAVSEAQIELRDVSTSPCSWYSRPSIPRPATRRTSPT